MDLTVKPPDPDRKPKGGQTQDAVTISPIPSLMATIQDDDELLLARIGYKQVPAPVLPCMPLIGPSNHTPIRNCDENSRNGPPFRMPSPS